ncbi:hypothetical protein [Sphingobium sp. CCH11-B1]|jgi:hypothetical protein|uniref:hypothetical protein n=1 Tax=Sphingobium sp. CCH11-B1 TaxID=1768781 RepID=UPI00082DD959|nr:hypothetical protein [Sphingobium sp. CCH11-B1]
MAILVLTDEEQQAVDEGEAAGSLLANPVFLTAIEAVRAQCAEGILTSEPSAREAREDAYNLSRGLSAVTVELRALKARAETILAQAEAQAEDEPLTDSSFGDY